MNGDNTHKKITTGYVVQVYAGVNCVSQRFVAGDQVDYLKLDDTCLDPEAINHYCKYEVYFPFDMMQPDLIKKVKPTRRVKFIAVLRTHLSREPHVKEIDDMMEEYMDYLEDFRDPCDIEDIRAAYLKEE